MKKNKKLNITNITKQNMREYGFTDAYTGKKSQENEWIKKLYKRNMKVNVIKEYIESYITGYKVGICTATDLSSAKVRNGEIYYNNEIVKEELNTNEIIEKIKVLTPNKKSKKKEGK